MVFVTFRNDEFVYSDVKTEYSVQLFPVKHKNFYVVLDDDVMFDDEYQEDESSKTKTLYLNIMNIIFQLENNIFKKGNYETFSDIFRKSNLDDSIDVNISS